MFCRQRLAGVVWLIDIAGATLFAWGLASAIAAWAVGASVSTAEVSAIVAGGLIRAGAVRLVHGLAITGAQATIAARRDQVFARLLGGAIDRPPSIGQAAVLAIDHMTTLENYEARFVPARLAATVTPLAVVSIVACASFVAAFILLLTLVPFAIGMVLAGTLARRASERQIEASGRLSGLFVDRLRTLSIIRHFRAEERITRQVRSATKEVAERTVAVLRAAFLSSAVLEFFSALAVALVAVYCGFSLLGLLPFPNPETLTLREAFFALAMAPEFYLPMRRLAAAYHDKQLGEAVRQELDDLGEAGAAVLVAGPFCGVEACVLEIEWPGRRVGPATLAVGATGMVALTGPTGSGKTSMLAAIAGQIAPAAGRITPVDAGDVAWAAQRPLILPGTLRDNLALARPDAGDALILEVAAQVGLVPLISERGSGLDLVLDHRGSGLSGGERRRLGIARAILSGRPLLLCDEPTADLDDAAAEAMVALLSELARTRAIIVATHDGRLASAADRTVSL